MSNSAHGNGKKSWTYLFAGFSLVATIGVLAAILSVYFYLTRPLDLAAHTDYLADELTAALKRSFLPEDAITLEGTETHTADGVTWDHYAYSVQVPAHLDVDGLKQLLQRAFVKHYVSVSEVEGGNMDGPARVLKLALADYEFATVTLKLPRPEAEQAVPDIRAEASQLAKDVQSAFADLGLDDKQVTGGDRVEQTDSAAQWASTAFQLALPESVDINAVLAAVEARLSYADATAYLARMSQRDNVLRVAYAGKDVVTVTTTPRGDAPADLLETMTPGERAGADLNETMGDALPSGEQLPLDSANAPEIPEGEHITKSATEQDESVAPRVAIILDDGGYGGPVTEALLALDPNLTLAILPNTPHAKDTAELGAARGFEIMLHMPMDTLSSTVTPFPGQINTTMERLEIQELTSAALAQIPHVEGVNNHTGSRFTGDAMRMEIFLELLKERGLYFIDSFTQPQSRGYTVARAAHVPTNRRDVFLDNSSAPAAIRAQFEQLVKIAKKRGMAIGIGHFRTQTVKSLAEFLPELRTQGITLVHASELVL